MGDSPGDNIDKVDIVTHLGDGRPRQNGVDGLAQRLRADAELTGTVLVDLDTDHLGRLVPVKVDILCARRIAEHRREALRVVADLRGIRTADAELERPADRRAELE